MDVLEPENFDSICRLCFGTDSLSSIFEIYCDNKCFTEILWECCSINVTKSDTLPKNICMNCVNSLCSVYNFLTLCNKTNNILLEVADEMKAETDSLEEEKIIIQIEDNEQFPESEGNEHKDVDQETQLSSQSHQVGGDNFFCEPCNESFHTLFELIHHFRAIKHSNGEYKCPACENLFSSERSFRKHLSFHSGCFRCNFCNKKFNFLSNLQNHVLSSHNQENFVCDSCGKEFRSSWFFHEHIAVHSGDKWCMCHKCGKLFSKYSKYFLHLKMHDTKRPKIKQIQRYDCVFCDKVLASFGMLKKHTMKYHMKNNPENIIFIENDTSLTTSEQKHRCVLCQKDFKTKYTYENHLKLHDDYKPFICHCGKAFRLQYNLKVHQRIHTGEKPYMCKECNRCFAQKQQLNTHIRTHTLERPFQCHYCDKAFATRGNATVHMRLHTGETPFICELCSRGYVDSSGLKRHKCTFGLDPMMVYEIKT